MTSSPTTDDLRWHHEQLHRHCNDCGVSVPVVDEFDDQIGYEEKARPVRVVVLDCDHDIVTPLRTWPGG